jgi:hypothetical protein
MQQGEVLLLVEFLEQSSTQQPKGATASRSFRKRLRMELSGLEEINKGFTIFLDNDFGVDI